MHLNIPDCKKCLEILNRYPGFYKPLLDWAIEFRSKNPDAHISWAGRGRADQELFFKKGFSRAHYGQSSHNYNAAIDWFRITQAGGASFESAWYKQVLGPAVLANPDLVWYGDPKHSQFFELPHIEWASWHALRDSGLLVLVEK